VWDWFLPLKGGTAKAWTSSLRDSTQRFVSRKPSRFDSEGRTLSVLVSLHIDHGGSVMLVLSRKVGERVLVGDKVVITVVRIGPNAVRLGVEAPQDVNIVRDELLDRPQEITEVDVPLDGVTVPGGSGSMIQVGVDDVADLGRR